jgi:hypothetical protein
VYRRRMPRIPLLLAVLLLSACGPGLQSAVRAAATPPVTADAGASPPTTPVPLVGVSPTRPPGARVVSSGCGNAPVYNGAIPSWASDNAPAYLNYVIATPDLAMGYLFSYPLHAGPDGNKILWYVRAPRGGRPLIADGHPVGSALPAVHFSQPDNSGPGEIYPSGVTVPSPGCWRFHLRWNGYAADVDLLFNP